MSTTLHPIITQAGLQAMLNAQSNGFNFELTQIKLGDTGWTPDASATDLKNPISQFALTGEVVNDTQLHITGIDQSANEFWIKEIGFYTNTGVLFAVWSHATQLFAYKSNGVDLALSINLVQTQVPASKITINSLSGFQLPLATQTKPGITKLSSAEDLIHKNPQTPVSAAQLMELAYTRVYDPKKHYQSGDIRWFSNSDNPLDAGAYYECYHPDGVLGKDPRDPVNRPSGWKNTDPSQPYCWVKIGKFLELPTIGSPISIQKATVNENYIKYRTDANLNISKFWRLAIVYPDLVQNNVISIADLRAEFIRGLDDGRGVDLSRPVGSFRPDSIRSHGHILYYGHGNSNMIHSGPDDLNNVGVPAEAGQGTYGYSDGVMSRAVKPFGSTETAPRSIAMLQKTRF